MDEYITAKSGVFEAGDPEKFANIPRTLIVKSREDIGIRYRYLDKIVAIPRFWKYLTPQKLWFQKLFMTLCYVVKNCPPELFVHVCRAAGYVHVQVYLNNFNLSLRTARFCFEPRLSENHIPSTCFEVSGSMDEYDEKLRSVGFRRTGKEYYANYHLNLTKI